MGDVVRLNGGPKLNIYWTITLGWVPNKFDKYLATSALQVGFPFFRTALGGNLSNVQKLCLPPKCNPVRCTELKIENTTATALELKCTLSMDGSNWLIYTNSLQSDMKNIARNCPDITIWNSLFGLKICNIFFTPPRSCSKKFMDSLSKMLLRTHLHWFGNH